MANQHRSVVKVVCVLSEREREKERGVRVISHLKSFMNGCLNLELISCDGAPEIDVNIRSVQGLPIKCACV